MLGAGRPLVLGMALVAAALSTVAGHAAYAPPGDLRDLMLIYCGPGEWKAPDFGPYVAYLAGPDGNRPQDWFYDSFLFMQFGGAPSGAMYIDGKTNKVDWDAFRRLIFDPDTNLNALDRTVGEMAAVLGKPPRRLPVVVMIPYPHPGVTDFGDVDGDGRSEDLGRPADLPKVLRWYVDSIIADFATARFTYLDLYGFYWMIEWVPNRAGEQAVRDAASAVHQRGLQFVWIPCSGAADAERSRELGFDVSYLQPNYAFMGQAGLDPDPQRLCATAERALGHGLGIEIELDPATPKDAGYRQNLIDYLAHGAANRDGYMRSAPHAYYQGSLTIKELHDSPLPANRRLYDALYRFARGTYADPSADRSLATGRACRFPLPPVAPPARAERLLTDGRKRELFSGDVSVVTWRDRASIELDLGGLRPVGTLRVHYQLPEASAKPPTWMAAAYSTTAEGQDWAGLSTLAPPQVEPQPEQRQFRTGSIQLRVARCDARRVRVDLWAPPGAALALDELEVLPAFPLADARCVLQPAPAAARGGDEAAERLTDGLYAEPTHADRALKWDRGPVEIAMDLGANVYLSGVALHLPSDGGRPARLPRSVEFRTAAGAGPWGPSSGSSAPGEAADGWLRVKGTPREARRIMVRVDPGDRPFVLDELQPLAPRNVALRRPYRLEPAFTGKYPDDGRKLTDGVRMVHGFGDGTAVGWSRADPMVTVDLGAEYPIEAVNVGAEGGGAAWVHFPQQLTLLASTDGVYFRPAGALTPQVRESGGEVLLQTLRLPADGRPARYVRLCIRRHGWAMLDEIEVLSGGRNVASGRPYSIIPPPDAEGKYADTTGEVLTDGEWGSLTWGEGKTVGFEGGKPAVEIDLGRSFAVRKLRAYVLGGGPGAVWFPNKITVLSSEDGRSWTPAGAAGDDPAEPGGDRMGAFMSLDLPGAPARYLRVEFAPHGWLMVGEIEAYEE